MSTSRPIAPPAHRPLPRAPLRRSWGHSAPRTGPPMDRRNDLQANPPALTKRQFPAHISPSVVFVSELTVVFVSELIAITGIRDHHRLEHLIAIPGIRIHWPGSYQLMQINQTPSNPFKLGLQSAD